MLPFMNGFDVTRRLRAERITTPILLLTARDAAGDDEDMTVSGTPSLLDSQ